MFRSRIQTQYPARTTPRSKPQTETDKNSASDRRCACDMSHDLAEKLGKHSRRLIGCSHETRATVRSKRRGGPLTHGRGLRQRKPQPLAPRPCACPVRTSAPSRHRATSAPAYHSSYLRNYHSFNIFQEAAPKRLPAFFLLFFGGGGLYTARARAHPPPPPRWGRAAHSVEPKAVVRIEVAVRPRPCLGYAVELVLRVAPLRRGVPPR